MASTNNPMNSMTPEHFQRIFGGNENPSKEQLFSSPSHQYASEHSLKLHPAQKKLIDRTMALPKRIMLSDTEEMQLLQNFVRCIGAKKTLDIGTFTGYSALSIALALPDDGKVVTCDVTDEYLTEVRGVEAWKEAGVEHMIQLELASATETLERLLQNGEAGTYDFAFIDADKPNYGNYYELCLQLIRKNGIIAIDNTLWFGLVHDHTANDANTLAIRAFNDKLFADDRVHISFLVLGDGTTLAFKK